MLLQLTFKTLAWLLLALSQLVVAQRSQALILQSFPVNATDAIIVSYEALAEHLVLKYNDCPLETHRVAQELLFVLNDSVEPEPGSTCIMRGVAHYNNTNLDFVALINFIELDEYQPDVPFLYSSDRDPATLVPLVSYSIYNASDTEMIVSWPGVSSQVLEYFNSHYLLRDGGFEGDYHRSQDEIEALEQQKQALSPAETIRVKPGQSLVTSFFPKVALENLKYVKIELAPRICQSECFSSLWGGVTSQIP